MPWAESLRSLQRDVPPRPLAQVIGLIEADFGCTLEEVGLHDFSAKPIGAASIGQVHTATLQGREAPLPPAGWSQGCGSCALSRVSTSSPARDPGGRAVEISINYKASST